MEKKIKGEHIKEQMGNVHVQEPRGHCPFPLSGLYPTDTELISVKKNGITKTLKGNKNIGGDDSDSGNMQIVHGQ